MIHHFYNKWHYGDNILNLKFFLNISSLLKERGILIHYYYDTEYCKNADELERYVDSDCVKLHPLSEKPDTAVETWMGNKIDGVTHEEFERYFSLYYKKLRTLLELDDPDLNICTSLYQNEPYLDTIYDALDSKFKDIDILIMNSEPGSGQFIYNKVEVDKFCIRLSKSYKIVTTSPVIEYITSTMRDGLKLQDIGAISTHAKYIITANSGPFTACCNRKAKMNVQHWFLLDNNIFKFNEIKYTAITDLNQIISETSKSDEDTSQTEAPNTSIEDNSCVVSNRRSNTFKSQP